MSNSAEYYVNLFTDRAGEVYAGQEVFWDISMAIRDAEDDADRYVCTYTASGKIDLSSDFSSRYHEERTASEYNDRVIDEMKSFTMEERHA